MIKMNTPKVVGCLLCGFRTENVLEIETFQEFGCTNCNKQMSIKITHTDNNGERVKWDNERETCGICSQDYLVKNTKDHQCPDDENIYTISLTFTTDRPLSDIELETLKSQLIAQIEEPVTADGDDVDYITNLIEEK